MGIGFKEYCIVHAKVWLSPLKLDGYGTVETFVFRIYSFLSSTILSRLFVPAVPYTGCKLKKRKRGSAGVAKHG